MKRVLLILITLYSTYCFSQENFIDIISKSEKAVCLIMTFDTNDKPLSFGTGFFIDRNGTCVSNYHIFDNAFKVKILTYDNNLYLLEEVKILLKDEDLIVFKINLDTTHFLKLNKSLPKKGEKIVVIGNPEGLGWSASEGIISSIRENGIGHQLQITAPISSGSSGSPVININGEVIGVATSLFKEGQNLNFAIHIGVLDSASSYDTTFYKPIKILIPVSDFDIAKSKIDSIKSTLTQFVSYKLDYVYTTYVTSNNEEANKIIKEYIEPFINKFPNSSLGYTFKGQILSSLAAWEKIYFDQAIESFSKAIMVDPSNEVVYKNRFDFILNCPFAFTISDTEEKNAILLAISDLKKYGKFSKENLIESSFKLGLIYEDYLKDYDSAIEIYSKLISVLDNVADKEKVAESYYYRAFMYWKLEKYNLAEQDFDKALSYKNDCRYRNSKVSLLVNQKNYESASRTIINSCLNTKEAYYNMSKVLYEIGGDLHAALLWINKAVAEEESVPKMFQDKTSLEAYYSLRMNINWDNQKYVEVIQDINRVLIVNPQKISDFNFNIFISEVKYRTKDYFGSLKIVNLLIVIQPNNSLLFEIKGDTLYELKDFLGAVKAYSRAIEISPKEGKLYTRRGLAKYYNNDKAGARLDLSKAGELGDYNAYEYLVKLNN